jgi:nitrogenase molybdenum-iron protein NifN
MAVVAEPDQLVGICQSLSEAGGRVTTAIAPTVSAQLERIDAGTVVVGDMEDLEEGLTGVDLIIGNCHCEALAERKRLALMLRGYPNWEEVGNSLQCDVLYEGGCNLLFTAANATKARRREQAHA